MKSKRSQSSSRSERGLFGVRSVRFIRRVVVAASLITAGAANRGWGQSDTTLRPSPGIIMVTDSLVAPGKERATKSPWLAVAMSAVAPGSGQIYNTNYWKVPVIWGLGGYWIYEWIQLNKKYADYRDRFVQSLVVAPGQGDGQLASTRDFYRNERDKFAWYLGGLYFLNLVDAYVGAHLYDFDVSPDLGADGRVYPKVTATLRLPLSF